MPTTKLTTEDQQLTTVSSQRNYTYINLIDYGARWYSPYNNPPGDDHETISHISNSSIVYICYWM